MNANDFYDWKRNPVTEHVMQILRERKQVLIEEIIEQTAYMSQSEMAEKAGGIKAYNDILNIDFEETPQETE